MRASTFNLTGEVQQTFSLEFLGQKPKANPGQKSFFSSNMCFKYCRNFDWIPNSSICWYNTKPEEEKHAKPDEELSKKHQ